LVSRTSEQRILAITASVLALAVVLWGTGWAVREATDVDPRLFDVAVRCLEREYGLTVTVPSDDPLADSAPQGAFRTKIGGNDVVASVWDDGDEAARTIETYERLTPEDLEGRGIARGRVAILWAEPATGAQTTMLYGCTG
jgi:hypothetical protein